MMPETPQLIILWVFNPDLLSLFIFLILFDFFSKNGQTGLVSHSKKKKVKIILFLVRMCNNKVRGKKI